MQLSVRGHTVVVYSYGRAHRKLRGASSGPVWAEMRRFVRVRQSGAGDCDGPSGRRGAALLAAAALNIADNYNDIRIVAQDTTRRLS